MMSTPLGTRSQLTLFVPAPYGARLDALRKTLDPIQASLIAAHVTLCREDEIAHIDPTALFARVHTWGHGPLHLTFGPPRRFSGHGVLLPCEQSAEQFHALRQWLLQDDGIRVHDAHLTLAHPRNARATGNTDDALAACPKDLRLHFASVSLIEQHHTAAWRLVRESALGAIE